MRRCSSGLGRLRPHRWTKDYCGVSMLRGRNVRRAIKPNTVVPAKTKIRMIIKCSIAVRVVMRCLCSTRVVASPRFMSLMIPIVPNSQSLPDDGINMMNSINAHDTTDMHAKTRIECWCRCRWNMMWTMHQSIATA